MSADTTQQYSGKYRADIDGLRAFAVSSVLIFHAFPKILPSGFIGVDVFFVISGYLITKILIEEHLKGNFSYINFYKRRVARIFPALITVTATSLIAGWHLLYADEYQQMSKHIAAGSIFSTNIALYLESGYFDNIAESKPMLHLWSLSVEEQFYLLWPLAIATTIGRSFLNRPLVPAALVVGSFACCLFLVNKDSSAAYYWPISRFWELGAGGLLAYRELKQKDHSLCMRIANKASLAGFALLILGLLLINKNRIFPGAWALLPVIGSALIIYAGPHAQPNQKILSNKIFVWIGLLSYPLYLWHWPLLSFARITLGATPTSTQKAAILFASLALAWATYRLIEAPIRNSKIRQKTPLIAGAFTCIAILSSTIYFSNGLAHRDALVGDVATPQVLRQFSGPLWQYQNEPNCLESHPFPESKNYPWWFCMTNRKTAPSVLLLGNSYANQLFPGFAKHPILGQHSILSIGTCDASGTVPTPLSDPSNPCANGRHIQQRDLIDRIIKNTPSLQFVVIDGLPDEPSPDYLSALSSRIRMLDGMKLQVILFSPHLKPKFDTKACFGRPSIGRSKSCDIPSTQVKSADDSFARVTEHLKQAHPNLLLFNQNIAFCNQERCSFTRDNHPLFRDETHISEFGSQVVAHAFFSWAQSAHPSILVISKGH